MPTRKPNARPSQHADSAPPHPGILGRWRMTSMSNWDNDFMDEEAPAFIEFLPGGDGEFHFGYVCCGIDWRADRRSPSTNPESVAFTFEGHDEMHPTHGRGRAALQPDGTVTGHLYFHGGDDSSFAASPIQTRPSKA